MTDKSLREKRLARWYFGGLASAGAACCTHPLDLLKVLLQTHQEGKLSLVQLTVHIVKKQGFLALYNGLSASLLRQLTYSTTRFAIYEVVKQNYSVDTFAGKVAVAAAAGCAGGFVGTPGDMVNVRMQNDIKLPAEKRRNYKHALDGLIRVYKEEGILRLFSGATTASSRAVFMTVGQLSFYDQIKVTLLNSGYFGDNLTTHFLSSLMAALVALFLTQPIDVVKTRMMSSKPGDLQKGLWSCIRITKREGFLAFYKGIVPSSTRIIPATILMFAFFEQLRIHFGYIPVDPKPKK
ncbi:mitochondrial dicarboxylate carrier isoform X2 [Sitophilus oryzae]|uniref:Mitochondrial dicarboxylate carrier isoform X2 n=1 Tax=Sitophilus oryzae TaxID=7048 RepID=A0A6J2XX14_SITOR|nr:mitochondrial dicarboxylate carrier isoform X2 [Sitophilus oryzae]